MLLLANITLINITIVKIEHNNLYYYYSYITKILSQLLYIVNLYNHTIYEPVLSIAQNITVLTTFYRSMSYKQHINHKNNRLRKTYPLYQLSLKYKSPMRYNTRLTNGTYITQGRLTRGGSNISIISPTVEVPFWTAMLPFSNAVLT